MILVATCLSICEVGYDAPPTYKFVQLLTVEAGILSPDRVEVAKRNCATEGREPDASSETRGTKHRGGAAHELGPAEPSPFVSDEAGASHPQSAGLLVGEVALGVERDREIFRKGFLKQRFCREGARRHRHPGVERIRILSGTKMSIMSCT